MGRQTRLTVGTVMSLLAFDFIAPAFPFFEEPWGMLAMWGVIVGQVNLIATWGALGPGNVVIRLPWSILLGVLTCCALALGLRAWRWGVAGDDFVALMGPVILGGGRRRADSALDRGQVLSVAVDQLGGWERRFAARTVSIQTSGT